MKHLFIINPVAGKGKTLKFIPEIEVLFKDRPDDYLIKITERAGHATEIARQYTKEDSFRVYSVGGDGTLNEVLNGMAESSSSLAVIPSGSGNDFMRSIDSHVDRSSILRRTIEGREEWVDLGRINEKYFINISSIGLDAEVAYNTIKLKSLPGINGSLAYVLGIFVTLFKHKSSYLKISVDGMNVETDTLLMAVANGKYYGGGMQPTPEAKIDDGILDICLVKAMSKPKILILLPLFMKGRHGGIKEVHFYKGKKIEVRCDRDMTVNIDGEIEKLRDAVFEIIPKGIRVVIPKRSNT